MADNTTLVLIVIELIGNPQWKIERNVSEVRCLLPLLATLLGASNEICAQGVRFGLEIRLSIRAKGAGRGWGEKDRQASLGNS